MNVNKYISWIYDDSLCVMCKKKYATIGHFVKCVEYWENLEVDWKDISRENMEHQFEIGRLTEKRWRQREI